MYGSADIAITTVTSILIITCIIGNSLVCAIIKRNREMRIPINYLLVNLAVGDIIYATFQITELVYRHITTHPNGFTGIIVCLLRNSALQWIGASSSIFTLVTIAFERYFVVLYPHGNRRKLTMRKLKGVLKARKRVTLMVFTVSAIFAICWDTDFILHYIDLFGSSKLSPYAIAIAHTVLMFNTAVNPFAYALIRERFRKKIKEILCCSARSSAARVLPSRDIEMPKSTGQSIDQQSRNKHHRVTHITPAPPDLANSSPAL